MTDLNWLRPFKNIIALLINCAKGNLPKEVGVSPKIDFAAKYPWIAHKVYVQRSFTMYSSRTLDYTFHCYSARMYKKQEVHKSMDLAKKSNREEVERPGTGWWADSAAEAIEKIEAYIAGEPERDRKGKEPPRPVYYSSVTNGAVG